MTLRGVTCFARAVVAVRSTGVVAVAAQLVAPAVVMARPLAAVRYSAGVMGREGKQGSQGLPGVSAGMTLYTAATPISGHKALMFAGSGRVVPADPTVLGYVYAGIALGAASPEGTVEAQTLGDLQADFWSWIADRPVFPAPGGKLTQDVPKTGWLHLIGWAVDAQTIHLVSSSPKLLQ